MRNIFIEKSCRKCALKLAPDPFLILLNNPKQCTQEILLKVKYFERGLSKSSLKVNFIFFSNPVPFNGQSYQKHKGPETSD